MRVQFNFNKLHFMPENFTSKQFEEYERKLNALLKTRHDAEKIFVGQIVDQLVADDYRFHTLVQAIVSSEPFQMRRGDGGAR